MVRSWKDEIFFGGQGEIYRTRVTLGDRAAQRSASRRQAGAEHAPQTWEFSVKDGKLYVKSEGKEYLMTKTGDRKFTFGENNENEVVFVRGKTGKIDYIFTGLYAAKRVL
jgi:hypothetical protein